MKYTHIKTMNCCPVCLHWSFGYSNDVNDILKGITRKQGECCCYLTLFSKVIKWVYTRIGVGLNIPSIVSGIVASGNSADSADIGIIQRRC